MKVLVTGGAGYIGSHTVLELIAAGYDPVIYDNFSEGHYYVPERLGVSFVSGDIADKQLLLETLCADSSFTSVIHFAANAYVGESVSDPLRYYTNNVVGSLSLIDAVLNCNLLRRVEGARQLSFIFSSTCATYGSASSDPIQETHHQSPVNPYGRTKLVIEQALQDYAAAYGLNSCILRYFNAAGAHPSGVIGEYHNPETHLIPLVLRAAARSTPITIYGDDYNTPDGTCVRDYIHVCDLAAAHVLAMRHIAENPSREIPLILNLGTGSGVSVLEVIDTAIRETGRSILKDFSVRRPGDPAILVADPQKAFETLGWRPRYTNISEIISDAWKWHESEGHFT